VDPYPKDNMIGKCQNFPPWGKGKLINMSTCRELSGSERKNMYKVNAFSLQLYAQV